VYDKLNIIVRKVQKIFTHIYAKTYSKYQNIDNLFARLL